MVVLRAIKRNQNKIEADYYPENRNAYGHISIDLSNGKRLEHIPAPDCFHEMYGSHAETELLRLAKLEKLPQEKFVLWY